MSNSTFRLKSVLVGVVHLLVVLVTGVKQSLKTKTRLEFDKKVPEEKDADIGINDGLDWKIRRKSVSDVH